MSSAVPSEDVIFDVINIARARKENGLADVYGAMPPSPRFTNAAIGISPYEAMRPSTSDEQITLLRNVIRQELLLLQGALLAEVQASKGECLANVESIVKDLKQIDSKWDSKFEEIRNVAMQDRQKAPSSRKQVEPQSQGIEKVQPNISEDESVISSTDEDLEEVQADPHKSVHGNPKNLWADFSEAVEEMDEEHNLYLPIMEKFKNQRSVWHNILDLCRLSYLVEMEPPNTCLAMITEHRFFSLLQTALILANTGLMGYEADLAIKNALQVPSKSLPDWLRTSNMVFTAAFTVELLFRIIALRSWFFVSPDDWAWNFFDVFIVCASIITDFVLTGINLSFIRSFRMLRALRAARIIRVLRFFRRLRQMLFAILSSLSSLMWFFIFLGGVMFMFSVLLLQGLTFALDDLSDDDVARGIAISEQLRPEDGNAWDVAQIQEWYGSIGNSMFSLLLSVTGGKDWEDLKQPLAPAGPVYTSAFVLYILFVTVGIINVLTGVFVGSSGDYFDESLVVLNEQIRVDNYVKQMMDLFDDMDLMGTGSIDWPTFQMSMKNERMQAYLSSLDLEPTHARLIFDLLDVKNDGKISMSELVMGFLRLKGEAKAIDARTIQRQISMIPKLLQLDFKAGQAAHGTKIGDETAV